MSITVCTNCGRLTDSFSSNYWHCTEIDGKTPKGCGIATQCFVSFVDWKCVKGCVYNDISPVRQKMFKQLLGKRDT